MQNLSTTFLLFLISTSTLYAQNGQLTGQVVNADGQPVSFASVAVKKTKAGTIANEKGEFSLKNITTGKHTILVTMVGYEAASQEIEIIDGHPTEAKIQLHETANTLQEINVVGNIGITKVKPQTIQYASKDLISQNGGTAGDILKAMPSVAMGGSPNHNRDIRFRGLGNGYTQVLINGQPIGVSGNNRETVLDLIPANQIERIEILANPTADVVSAGVNGVVNIILKKGVPATKLYETIGRASFTADHQGGYNGGLSLNGRARNLTAGANFDRLYRIVENKSTGEILKLNNAGEKTEVQNQKKNENKKFTNNSAKGFLGYNTKGWDFYTEYLYGDQTEDKSKEERTSIFDATNKFKSGKFVLSPELRKVYFHSPSARITKNLGKHEFQLSYNYNKSGENKTQNQNEYALLETNEPVLNKTPKMQKVEDRISLNTQLPGLYWLSSIVKNTTLKVGYQGFYTTRTIARTTDAYDEKSNTWKPKDEGKNNFEANESVNAMYATFQWNTEKLKTNFGYRHEIADIRTKASSQTNYSNGHYSTALPSVHVQYFLSSKTYLASSVGRRIRRPGFNDLNPYVEIKSTTEQKVGNPDLRPERAWAYEMGVFTQIKDFNIGANLFLRDIRDLIQKNITEENGIFTEKQINLRGAKTSGIELVSAAKIGEWLNVNGNYSRFWSKISSDDINNGDQLKDQFAWTAKVLADFSLPSKINAQIISNWVGPKNTVQEGEGKVHFVDIGIQKTFGKNNALFLRATDIFDNLKKHKYTNTATQVSNTYEHTQGRILSVGASVNF
ncbi:TonB-dependent receptor [Emticicia fluvialis]|uniref:TonB-dependent receptor n=1 Tax=Emticicia fluvialis TaxID=2974474 RepID=UPI0021669199|nr:TonB-dependent receptor [Emticicia fluvialis]